MKARHGTRMVQVVTADWLLHLILDEPPQLLENAWRSQRVEYYRRLEPTEAPRDVEPYKPPKERLHKVLRLEDDASDRMWNILLRDDELNKMEEATEKATFDQARQSVKMDSAEEITDKVLKLHLDDSWVDEKGRLQHSKLFVDHTGPAKRGWTKTDVDMTHQLPLMQV